MVSSTGPLETMSAEAASKGLFTRVVGILFSPRATYADVAARPRWIGTLVILMAVGAVGSFLFLSTDVGREAWIDAAVQQRESYGRTVTDAQYAGLERMSQYVAPMFAAAQLIALPIVAAAIAGLAVTAFNVFKWGDAAFKQVFAVVVHSGVVMAVAQLFGLPLAYARQTMTSAANLAVFAPFLDESSFSARLLGAIDLFVIWWAVSLAIGLGVLYRRRTAPIAATLIGIYVAIGVVIAVVKTVASGA